MHPLHDYIRNETRRQFLSRGSNAVSWAALAALLGREGLVPPARADAAEAGASPTPTGGRALARAASLRPQGQAGDLSAHGGRAAADGHV